MRPRKGGKAKEINFRKVHGKEKKKKKKKKKKKTPPQTSRISKKHPEQLKQKEPTPSWEKLKINKSGGSSEGEAVRATTFQSKKRWSLGKEGGKEIPLIEKGRSRRKIEDSVSWTGRVQKKRWGRSHLRATSGRRLIESLGGSLTKEAN